MKIILLEDIPKLGNKGEVKEVKNGFAKNFLLPKKLAQIATEEKMKEENRKKILHVQENEKKYAENLALKEKIEKINFSFQLKFSPKGKSAYNSVNAESIKEELKKQGIIIKKSQIKLKKPLREEGFYEIPLYLSGNIKTKLKLTIKRSA